MGTSFIASKGGDMNKHIIISIEELRRILEEVLDAKMAPLLEAIDLLNQRLDELNQKLDDRESGLGNK
jgi:hypothetical protein